MDDCKSFNLLLHQVFYRLVNFNLGLCNNDVVHPVNLENLMNAKNLHEEIFLIPTGVRKSGYYYVNS